MVGMDEAFLGNTDLLQFVGISLLHVQCMALCLDAASELGWDVNIQSVVRNTVRYSVRYFGEPVQMITFHVSLALAFKLSISYSSLLLCECMLLFLHLPYIRDIVRMQMFLWEKVFATSVSCGMSGFFML